MKIGRMFKTAVRRGRSEGGGEAYSFRYVEPPSDARTKLAAFFNILLVVFQCDALQDIGHVFATVGAGLKPLINFFPLDDHHRIGLFLEQLRDGITGNTVGFVLETVDLNAAL